MLMEDKELEKTGEQNKDPAPRPVKLPLRDRDSEPAFNWGDTEPVVFTPQTGTPAKERAAKPAKEKRERAPEPPKPPRAEKEKTPKPPKAKKEKAPEPPKPAKAKKDKAPKPPKPPKAKKDKAPKPPKPPKAKKDKAPKPPKPPKVKREKAPKPPKAGRERKRREVTGKRRIAVITAQILLGLFLCAVAVSGAYVAYVAVSSNDIDPHNIYAAVDTSTVLYDKNGEAIDKVYYSEDRELVTINEIPEYTKDAFIAIEDKTFYEHHGFNLRRMIGAVINKLLGRTDAISGTSTITQQLARNVFLPDVKSQRTLRRKG